MNILSEKMLFMQNLPLSQVGKGKISPTLYFWKVNKYVVYSIIILIVLIETGFQVVVFLFLL